jgi:hypothetical protein
LENLFDTSLISSEEVEDTSVLRQMVMNLDGGDEWNIEPYRTSEIWRYMMRLSDKLVEHYQ